MGADTNKCDSTDCPRPPRMALQVFNTNGVLHMKVWFDERQMGPKATAYCKACGLKVMREIADTVVNLDEDE